jgi:GT2 family glycosyltransferase
VQEKWLKKMVHTLENSYRCAFVGPSTNNCHSPQKTIPSPDDAARSKYKNVAVHMEDPISGFCLLFRKSLWEDLGGFDPKYKHYGQESDFIDRAHKKGWLSYWRQDAFVYHIGEASVKASGIDVNAARKEAKKIYWSTRK